MEFVEITEKEYFKFWENHELKTFLSAVEIGKLRQKSGWEVYYVGLKEKKKIVAAAMLVSHKRHFNTYEFYSPRGFLLDFHNKELLELFTQEISQYIKRKRGYVLRIDPYIIHKQRDLDGNIVEGGIDNTEIVNHLKNLGYKRVREEDMEQVGWMFSLDLDGKTEEQILKEMKQNTRNTIRKTEKIGITVKEISYEELPRFHHIMEETGERKNFSIRKIDYYQQMYQLFHDQGQVKFFITELDLSKYLKKLKKEKKELEEKIEKIGDTKRSKGQKKELSEEVKNIETKICSTEEIRKKAGKDVITLSGSMFLLIQPEVVYLSSGNYEEYLTFNSQYLIQWELIKYGIKNGFKKHNFYGIPAHINTHPKEYGIYAFKRGFNGYVEELIGEYELPLRKEYYLLKILHKIRK